MSDDKVDVDRLAAAVASLDADVLALQEVDRDQPRSHLADLTAVAAEAMGADAACVLKTLMVLVDNKPACVILPSDREVNLKKLAAALGGKAAQMMKPADAERITGYHVGGISPFGQKKRVPTVLEQSAFEHAQVFMNGGQRGLQVKLDPRAAAEVLGAKIAGVV